MKILNKKSLTKERKKGTKKILSGANRRKYLFRVEP